MKVVLSCLPSNSSLDILKREEVPPLALYVLATSVRSCGLEPVVFDPNKFSGFSILSIEDLFFEMIDPFKTDILAFGFSVNSFNWAVTLKVIRSLKLYMDKIPIIVGGLHATRFPDHVLQVSGADYAIIGEGEITLALLLEQIRNGAPYQPIKSVVSSIGPNNNDSYSYGLLPLKEFRTLPPPAFDLLPFKSYDLMPLESSRGCLYSCAFCSIPHRKDWRGIDVASMISRVRYAKQFIARFNNRNVINFTDDCFTQDVDRAKLLLAELLKLQDGFKYFIEARVSNLLTNGLITAIPTSTVSVMQIGIECGYDEGLKLVRKGITMERVWECLAELRKCGLNKKSFLSFIIGFPWEGEHEIMETIATVHRIVVEYKVKCVINWLIFLPSDLWLERELYSINVDESLYDQLIWSGRRDNFFLCHPNITPEVFARVSKSIFALQATQPLIEYHHPKFLNPREETILN